MRDRHLLPIFIICVTVALALQYGSIIRSRVEIMLAAFNATAPAAQPVACHDDRANPFCNTK